MMFEFCIGLSFDERDEWGTQSAKTMVAAARKVATYYDVRDGTVIWVRKPGAEAIQFLACVGDVKIIIRR